MYEVMDIFKDWMENVEWAVLPYGTTRFPLRSGEWCD